MARGKAIVGLDIGSSSVKMCVLKRVKNGYSLQSFGMTALPSEAIVDGALMNSSAVAEAIGELLRSHKVKVKEAAIAISGHSVIIKKINLPQMTADELEGQIRFEAEQYIPFDINDVHLDVQIVKPAPTPQQQMDVLLVAAKKDMINDYVQVVTESGLMPIICDVDAFAVENAFEANYDVPSSDTIVLVNIGAAKTNINVLSKGVSSFTRDINIGGNAFSEEIQKRLNVSYDEAEALKIGGGANETDGVMPQDVEQVLSTVNETMAGEIQRTLDFYSATSADTRFAKIYLSGGTAKLASLANNLGSRLGTTVEVVNAFKRVEVDPKKFDIEYLKNVAPQAAVAVGLATRFIGDK
jgi:type IV pilus assembly protein PilM